MVCRCTESTHVFSSSEAFACSSSRVAICALPPSIENRRGSAVGSMDTMPAARHLAESVLLLLLLTSVSCMRLKHEDILSF